MINIIVAKTENNVIGNNGDLVVNNKEDMALFKELTEHHYVVMGRKTFESLKKPLVNRKHIVLTNSPKENECGIYYMTFNQFKEMYNSNIVYWVIGGGEIYKLFLDSGMVDSVYVSIFPAEVEGDTYFPNIPKNYTRKYIKYFNTFKQEIYLK